MSFTLRIALYLIFIAGNVSISVGSGLAQSKSSSGLRPEWIWHSDASIVGPRQNASNRFAFEKTFEIGEPIRTAQLRGAADFCDVTVLFNGKPLVAIEAFSQTVDMDITDSIQLGRNVLRIEAIAIPGPAAIALSLEIYSANEANSVTVVTDASWSASAVGQTASPSKQRQARSLGKVSEALWGIGRRSSKVDAVENYEQWRQAEAGKSLSENQFWTAPDFKISLIRSAQPDEDSWVSMAFDPQGRLTIAKEEKGLLRMTLDKSRLTVEKVEPLVDQLLECRGMVYAHDSLYVNANNSKGMFRLRDSDGDDQLDEIDLLRAFPGSVGHGRNDLTLGPDGWLYSIHGDSVDVPTSQIIDHTSPFRESRKGQSTREGHFVRTDPEGKTWEMLCAGLRNPYGLAVNPDGEWFTYDADAEFDMGAPWYRPTRVIHLVSGADYGWRGVTGKWPPYYPDHPDNAMPTLNIGRGSPTAVSFGTDARFNSEYRQALFILDWTYGRILAIHLAPRGAGYRAYAETFLQGRPLNVTDLAIGPDGAMYIITGGRKTQSALYRITFEGKVDDNDEMSQHEQESIADAASARSLRKQLELGHGSSSQSLDLAWQHLDSADWTIRYAARIAIEHQPIDSWRDKALTETRRLAAIEASFALVRSGEIGVASAVLDRLLSLPASTLSLGEIWSVIQLYSQMHGTASDAVQANRGAIIEQTESITARLQSGPLQVCRCGTSSQVQGQAALLLANLEADSAVAATVESLLTSPLQEDRLQGLFAVRNSKTGWTSDFRRKYFEVLNEGSRFVSGEGMPKFLSKIREEAVATLDDAQRAEFSELLAPSELPDDPLPPARPFVKQWTVEELVSLLANSKHRPDASRGATIFHDALCHRCHRSGARGPAVGPDLTHVASRFSRRDIIESTIVPSKVIAENYRGVQLTTADGRVIVGRVLVEGDYRSQKMQIATDPLRPTEVVELDKKEIENLRDSSISPMPAGLLDTFKLDEIIDLLEFLVNSGGSDR